MSVLSILIRVVLLLLSLVSFIPQYHGIWSRRNCSGISLYYVLFNLIAFTEQFALGLNYIVVNVEVMDSIVASPPTAGDWLNLCQHFIVWVCYSVLFILCLSYSPDRTGTKSTVSTIYLSFLLISLAPVIFESSLALPGDSMEHDGQWFTAIFFGVHSIFINPIVTLTGFASLWAQQSSEVLSPLGALSITGLAVQAVVFSLVAINWPLRMTVPVDFWDIVLNLRTLITWYQLVGWAAVDNAIFAIVQAVLLWIATRRRNRVQVVTTNDEAAPLLQS